MNLCAIDLGFMYNKGIINNKRIMHKSVVGNGKTLRFQNLDMNKSDKKDNIVCNLDESYFVSDLAIEQSDAIYHSLKSNRFDADATKVLINTMLGIGFGPGNHTAYVVSGLPISHYADFNHEIQSLFLGVNGKTHEYHLEVDKNAIDGSVILLKGMFVPQPFAVLMNEVLNNKGEIESKELAVYTTAVIDCGFGTTDVYVTNGLTPIEKFTFSTNTAMNHAYRLIAEKLEIFNTSFPLYSIEPVVLSGKVSTSVGTFDVRDIINWAMKSTAEQLISEIYNKWKSTNMISNIIIAGGGGKQLQSHIQKELNSTRLSKSGQFAVSEGYLKWGIRKWKGEL